VARPCRTASRGIYTEEGNVVPGRDSTPQKPRVLVQLALTFTDDVDQIRDWFAVYGNQQLGYDDPAQNR
jgi:L-asparaginase/Glu-tRNA(Gln) amidotransferase subunit D